MGTGRGTPEQRRVTERACTRRVADAAPGAPAPRTRHGVQGRAALALANQRLEAEVQVRVREVEASRARIVEAGDRERRRVERNLHDGAQQRLVGLALALRLASRTAEGDPDLTALLADAAAEVDAALDELRALARGLHPAVVTDAGLGPALATLAERPGIPVELSVDLPHRVDEAAEVGAYYVVAEALANVNRHAGAEQVTVRAHVREGSLHLSVRDDGRGGAVVAPGSGLEGLADRVGALGGQLVVDSPAGCGTTLAATIPLP